MLPEPEEFRPPSTVAWLRGFGALCLIVAGGAAYAAWDAAALVPMTSVAYAGLVTLLCLLPLTSAALAYGLASVAESSARTAWELRIRRR